MLKQGEITGSIAMASALGLHALLSKLVAREVLSQADAADVMVTTARRIREGTEDDHLADFGEGLARTYEAMGGWLLGIRTSPPGKDA